MKLILTLHSKKIRGTKQLTLRQLISAFVLGSIVLLVSSRSTTSTSEYLARIELAQQQLSIQSSELNQIEEKVDDQLAAYASQVASLKQRLSVMDSKVDMLSQQIDLQLPAQTLQNVEPEQYVSTLSEQLKMLDARVQDKQEQLQLLEKLYEGHHVENQVQISGRPVTWGWLSSSFGLRNDPFTGSPAMHKGVDFAGKANGEVVSTGAGVVTWAGDRFGYGLLVEIDHGNGLVTRYGHNSQVLVKIGDVVTKGDIIASMGSTGRSTGVHVHYEVLKHGQHVDPLAYLN